MYGIFTSTLQQKLVWQVYTLIKSLNNLYTYMILKLKLRNKRKIFNLQLGFDKANHNFKP
jgi:hypothetical protein